MLVECVYYILRFCNTKRMIAVKQEGSRVFNHSGRSYRKGTGTCQIHGRMTIHTICGWEVWFDKYFRSYREFTSLNFCMFLLCYRYIVIYAFNTQVMLLQRIDVKCILHLSVSFIILQRSCVTLLLCFYIYFMLSCWYGSQYIVCFYKETLSRYCYNFTRKHIFNGFITVLNHSIIKKLC